MACSVATEHGTDEDTEIAGRIPKIAFDSFIRRPSLKDEAMINLAKFINNGLFVMNEPGCSSGCDSAILYILKNQARWLISGNARVLHFVDGILQGQSAEETAPILGLNPDYHTQLEPEFTLPAGKNAFLLCSNAFAKQVTPEEIQQALQSASGAQDWLSALRKRMPRDTQYCLAGILLAEPKKRLPVAVLVGLLVAVAALVALALYGFLR